MVKFWNQPDHQLGSRFKDDIVATANGKRFYLHSFLNPKNVFRFNEINIYFEKIMKLLVHEPIEYSTSRTSIINFIASNKVITIVV